VDGVAALLFPVVVVFFALAMERVELRLRPLSVGEQEVGEFLDQASTREVAVLAHQGLPPALARFHRRRRPADRSRLAAESALAAERQARAQRRAGKRTPNRSR
jgi:hypothetical protein